MSETSSASLGFGQFVYFYYYGLLMLGYHHLADAFARLDSLCLAAQINQYDAYLSPIVGINSARRIQYGQSPLERQTAARTNLRLIACGQFDE